MTVDRYAKLSPPQVVATLRSLPRRHREALQAAPPDLDPHRIAAAPTPDGRTIAQLLATTEHHIGLLARALERSVITEDATVDATLLGSEPAEGPPEPGSLTGLLEHLDVAVTGLADRMDAVPSESWLRRARLVGGGARGEVTAEQIAQHAARVGVENLRILERAIEDLAGHHGVLTE